jgi:hypothetical protein
MCCLKIIPLQFLGFDLIHFSASLHRVIMTENPVKTFSYPSPLNRYYFFAEHQRLVNNQFYLKNDYMHKKIKKDISI